MDLGDLRAAKLGYQPVPLSGVGMQRPVRLEACQEQRRQYPAGPGLEKAYGCRGACARMVQLPPRRGADRLLRPKLLGSSIIEGENVGMNLKQASCISCHS